MANLNGLEVEVPEFKMGEDNRTPEYLAKFPMGKIPAFEGADGFCLAEGAAICMYLAGAGPKAQQLLGGMGELQKRARITEWICFAETEIIPNIIIPYVMCVIKYMPYDEARMTQCATSIERALQRIDIAVQGGKQYLEGDELTLADIMVAGALFMPMSFFVDAEMRKAAPNATKYLENLAAQPEFQKVFGELKQCETRAKP